MRNVRAAGGEAFIKRGRSRPVRLIEIPPNQRAPILKAWCRVATSGRRHLPVSHDAQVSTFEVVGILPSFSHRPSGIASDVPGHLRPIDDVCAMSVSPPTSDVLLSRGKRAPAVILDDPSQRRCCPPALCAAKYHSAAAGCCTAASMPGDR